MTYEEHAKSIQGAVTILESELGYAKSKGYTVGLSTVPPNKTTQDRFIFVTLSKDVHDV